MIQYCPKPYEPSREDINVKVDLSNYETKTDKIDLAKLKTFPVDLSKLNNVANNEVFNKTVYDKLVAKVNNIDISGFILRNKYDIDRSNLEKTISDAKNKIPNTIGLVKKQIKIEELLK